MTVATESGRTLVLDHLGHDGAYYRDQAVAGLDPAQWVECREAGDRIASILGKGALFVSDEMLAHVASVTGGASLSGHTWRGSADGTSFDRCGPLRYYSTQTVERTVTLAKKMRDARDDYITQLMEDVAG